MHLKIGLSRKASFVPRAGADLAEEFGLSVFLLYMAAKTGFIAEVDAIAAGFCAGIGTSVFIHVLVEIRFPVKSPLV